MQGRATIVQVARAAGVSIKTVSRVTNREPHVSAAVRERVEAAIQRLGYHPMQSARHLATHRSRLLALVYDDPSPSHLVRLQHAARQCCQEQGYRLLFHPCDHRDPRLPAELVELASGMSLEGLVLTPPVSSSTAVVQALRAARVPMALLAPASAAPDDCAVLLDDGHAAQVLTAHVLAQGHQRIGFVRGLEDHPASRARLAGFRAAMAQAQLHVDEALLVAGDFSFDSGRSAGAALLDRQQRPSAIIAGNDDMAAGVMAAAHDRGVAIPAQLAVCGFDDTPLATMLWPPLTTMHMPLGEMAHAGTRMLLERIQHGNAQPADALRYELVVRASTQAGA